MLLADDAVTEGSKMVMVMTPVPGAVFGKALSRPVDRGETSTERLQPDVGSDEVAAAIETGCCR